MRKSDSRSTNPNEKPGASNRVGTFAEFLKLDPNKIQGVTVTESPKLEELRKKYQQEPPTTETKTTNSTMPSAAKRLNPQEASDAADERFLKAFQKNLEEMKREEKVSPQEDARLPLYKNLVLSQWETFARKSYQTTLKEQGQAAVDERVNQIAIQAIVVLHQYQEQGLSPHMGREAAMDVITGSLNLELSDCSMSSPSSTTQGRPAMQSTSSSKGASRRLSPQELAEQGAARAQRNMVVALSKMRRGEKVREQ